MATLQILVAGLQWKRHFGRPKRRWEEKRKIRIKIWCVILWSGLVSDLRTDWLTLQVTKRGRVRDAVRIYIQQVLSFSTQQIYSVL